MSIEQHQAELLRAFARVMRAEDDIRLAKSSLERATAELRVDISEGEKGLAEAWAAVAKLMAETGEVEVTLPGAANDFRIGWGSPRESVDVPDPDAVPDRFVKVERVPLKKEIGEHLKALRGGHLALPNWASLKAGERKLGYRVIKKGAS